jgi:hypothetical protein
MRPKQGRLTNRWSCRLRWSSGSYECLFCGSLRTGDSAAQLNSMLGLSGRHNFGCWTNAPIADDMPCAQDLSSVIRGHHFNSRGHIVSLNARVATEDCFTVCQSKRMKTVTSLGHTNLVATNWRELTESYIVIGTLSEEAKGPLLRYLSDPTSRQAFSSPSFSASSYPFSCLCSPSSGSLPKKLTLYQTCMQSGLGGEEFGPPTPYS